MALMIHIETVQTTDGVRYIGVITPANHPHITEVGTGWCESPVQAVWAARWHYGLAVQAHEVWISAREAQEARAA